MRPAPKIRRNGGLVAMSAQAAETHPHEAPKISRTSRTEGVFLPSKSSPSHFIFQVPLFAIVHVINAVIEIVP